MSHPIHRVARFDIVGPYRLAVSRNVWTIAFVNVRVALSQSRSKALHTLLVACRDAQTNDQLRMLIYIVADGVVFSINTPKHSNLII